MSDQNMEGYNPEEHYEETFDEYEYNGEGDYDDNAWGTEVTEIVETYEEVFTNAFNNFASLKSESTEDFDDVKVVLTHEQAIQFVTRIGLDSRAQSIIEDTQQNEFESSELYHLVESTGCLDDANISHARQFKNITAVLNIFKMFTTSGAFVSKNHCVDGETRFIFGPVEGEGKAFYKFSLNKSLDDTQTKIFDANPDAFFASSCDIELVSKEALEFVKECFTLMVDVISVFTRQIGSGLQVKFHTLPESDRHLRITLIGNSFREPFQGNILYALEFAHSLLPEFNCEFKWDYNLKNALEKPLNQLSNVEFSTSIPRLGIQPHLITAVCNQIEEAVEQFLPGENITQTITNFDEFKAGNTNVVLDFTKTVNRLFEKGSGMFDPSSTLLSLVQKFAPIGAELVFGLIEIDPSLESSDIVKGISSLLELIKKIVGRDFVDCTNISVRTRQGYGFTQQTHNFMNIDVLFTFLKDLLNAVAGAIKKEE